MFRALRSTPGIRPALILAVSALLSVLGYRVAARLDAAWIGEHFELTASNRVTDVRNALNEQHRLLESVAALWGSSELVTRDEFRAFVTPLLSHTPQLQGIGWAPRVASENLAAFEREVRDGDLPGFRVTERGPGGEWVAASPRAAHYPVLYLEPPTGNMPAFGYDLGSESARLAALEAARDTGRVQTTTRLQLVQDSADRVAFLSAMPIYRKGATLDSVEARRRELLGFATQVFRISGLIRGGLGDVKPEGIDFHIIDESEPPDRRLIYVHASRLRAPDEAQVAKLETYADAGPRFDGAVDIGGREWKVICTPAPGFLRAHASALPRSTLWVGLLFGVLAAGSLALQERRTRLLDAANAALGDEISQHERTEAALRRSEEWLQTVLQNMPALMQAFDAKQRIVAWNRECERVSGYTAGEMQGSPDAIARLYPDAERRERMLRGWSEAADEYRNSELTLRAKDGSERTIAWSNISRRFPVPGWSSWGIGIDVTDRRRAERERAEIQGQLLQAQKLESLGVLAGGIAHDFNNLLTPILGNASLALEELPAASFAHEMIQEVVSASERAALLTQQLLAYAGRRTRESRRIDLSDHVRRMRGLLATAISRRVSLDLDLGEDLPPLEADPVQIEQVIMNLVINGAESHGTAPGRVAVRTRVRKVGPGDAIPGVMAEHDGGLAPGTYVCVEVSDEGAGMDEPTRLRIFDPFFTTKFTGRGLGLAVVLGIVRAHHGAVSVRSEPGKGSTFTVLLPAAIGAGQAEHPVVVGDVSGRGLVLVVDDEQMVRRLAARMLTGLGYEVLEAESGQQAIAIFRERHDEIACVLLDLTMPEMDGAETFRALRRIRSEVVTVFSSGYDRSAASEQPVTSGLASFVQKPYRIRELGAAIREALDGRPGSA